MRNYGVLVIVHGTKNEEAIDGFRTMIDYVQTNLPVVLCYLEFDEEKSISNGVKYLESKGVTQIIAIPLFVSSGSTHLEEIQYTLGIIKQPSFQTDIEPLNMQTPVIWCDPLNDHEYVKNILLEQIDSLSHSPKEEVLLFIAHGSEVPKNDEIWNTFLNNLTSRIEANYSFHKISYSTLHPDNVRERAETLLQTGKNLIVIPLVVSPGYLTKKLIPTKLNGLPYRWNGQTYVPHPLISKWIDDQIGDAIRRKENEQ